MSQSTLEPALPMTTIPEPARRRPLSTLSAFVLALLLPVAPRRIGTLWLRVKPWRAALVGLVNMAALPFWGLAFLVMWRFWDEGLTSFTSPGARGVMARAWAPLRTDLSLVFNRGTYATASAIAIYGLLTVLAVALVFFVLLPFAARPGSNRACVAHVARAALLATAYVHLWMAALTGTIAVMILRHVQPGSEWMPPVFAVICGLALLSVWSLIRAIRVDYRAPADLPPEKTPQCDECGYDLHMSDPAGRCPECGRPVAQSLDPVHRQPTAWERDPRVTGLALIRQQTREVIRRPRELFFGMPTMTGQPAAQRWLILWMTVVGGIVFWTVPAMTLLLRFGKAGRGSPLWIRQAPEGIEWSSTLVLTVLIGGAAMAILWAIFGMMMVGVETAGVVAVAHFRKQSVPLASAAKVTCYAAPLMAMWSILGGLQILGLIFAYQRGWLYLHPQAEQVVLVVSTSVAHIGGLRWFEWTVYRGLRAIQYANH